MEWLLITLLLALAATLRMGPLLQHRGFGPECDGDASPEGLAAQVAAMRADRLSDGIDRYVVYLRRRERLLTVAEESVDDVRAEIEQARASLSVYLDESRRRGQRSRRRNWRGFGFV